LRILFLYAKIFITIRAIDEVAGNDRARSACLGS
jgi:hypothetical protein